MSAKPVTDLFRSNPEMIEPGGIRRGRGEPEVRYCPCLDGVHDDCWFYYQGCCCHNLFGHDDCPPTGCAHRNAQHEGIPQRLAYVMNHQAEFGADYPSW